jgi:predicted 3-demethylubiquinone-9 3-methyltransferase (glyoxalase superfamily)
MGFIRRYPNAGMEVHGQKPGTVMTAEFELEGEPFFSLNGGPVFKFTEAISFQIHCDNQDEIDYFWGKLTQGGEEGNCGWLKDKYGLSWQVIPRVLPQLLSDDKNGQQVVQAMMEMKKIDVPALEKIAGRTCVLTPDPKARKITPCLWFENQAGEAAKFYSTVFKNAKKGSESYFGKAGQETHQQEEGSVMTSEFELEGHQFIGLNGARCKFNESVSFQIRCDSQQEIDYFWGSLGEPGQCGWVKDKFGVSWQVVPSTMPKLMDTSPERAERIMTKMLTMTKIDIAAIEQA